MGVAMLAPRPPADAASDTIAAVGAFMRAGSLEATRPNADDIAALARALAPGTHVYLSAVLTRPQEEVVAQAAAVRAAGLEPVPHLAVRNFASADELRRFLDRLAGEAGVRRLLVIAGDRAEPAGPFHGALEAIDSGLIARHGIAAIGIAGYPDGHPRIPQHDLDVALADKVAAAEAVGVGVHVVTQFCFEPQAILAWVRRLRSFGMEHPVRIGLTGPTSLSTLLRYAQRCGVRASAQALARQTGLMRQLFAMSAPDPLVRALAEARAGWLTGEIAPHFFSFGGLLPSARWAAAVADGRIALDGREGFRVEPP